MNSLLVTVRRYIASSINFIERHIRTDVKYLAKGGLWLLTGHGVSMVSSFLLAIVFANLVPSHIYGTYKYVLAGAGILTAFTLPGINTYLAQAVSRGKDRSVLLGIRLRITWGVVAAVIALGVALYYFFNQNTELAFAFGIVAIFLPFFDAFGLYNVYLQGKQQFRISISYFSITQIVSTICIVGAAAFSQNIFIILLAYFVPIATLRFWFLLQTLRKYPPTGPADSATSSYGKHLSLINIPGQIASYLDSILLFHYLGPMQLAVYTFALAPIEQIRGVYKNITPLALPKLANRSISEINTLLPWRMLLLSVIGAGIASIYIFIAPFAFSILFPTYQDSVFISQLLAGLIALRLPGSFFAAVMQSRISVLPKSWLYWSVVPSSLFILLLLVLTPLYGVFGVIVSKYASNIIAGVIGAVQWNILSRRND